MKTLLLAILLTLGTLSAEAASPATAQQNALNHFAFRGDQRSQRAFIALSMTRSSGRTHLTGSQILLILVGGGAGILALFGLVSLSIKGYQIYGQRR